VATGNYGGAEGVADKLKQALLNAHPNLEVAGTLCPPFRALTPEEDQADIDAINMARPDIIWVGLSRPKAGVLDGEPPRAH
jgi:N-acetylglucosaminyldiphosphoundecaprenol N-acetyl-beta-D-mannosaminyltransferase